MMTYDRFIHARSLVTSIKKNNKQEPEQGTMMMMPPLPAALIGASPLEWCHVILAATVVCIIVMAAK